MSTENSPSDSNGITSRKRDFLKTTGLVGLFSITSFSVLELLNSVQSRDPVLAAQADLTGNNIQIDTQDGSVSDLQLNPTNTEITLDYDNFNQDVENNADEFNVSLEFRPLGSDFYVLDGVEESEIPEMPLTNSSGTIFAIKFDRSDSYIAYGGEDNSVYIHNL